VSLRARRALVATLDGFACVSAILPPRGERIVFFVDLFLVARSRVGVVATVPVA